MPIQGQVKWFDPKKGYGFLVGPDAQDVFVHYSQIMGEGFRTLNDGDSVDYDLVNGDKGFMAQNVHVQPAAVDPTAPPPEDEAEAQRRHARAMADDDAADPID